MRYAVTLRTRFDETTISSHRPKDLPLPPNPRQVRLVDGRGRQYDLAGSKPASLTTPLKPGDSYTTELDFAVPDDARHLRLLLVSAPEWENLVLIGDENSWLHKKTFFAL
jgi:hypothetical protein